MSLSHSKKGISGRVIIATLVLLTAFGIIFIMGHLIMTNLITAFDDAGYYEGKAIEAGNGFLNAFRIMDYLIIVVAIAAILSTAVLSYRLASAPVFFVIMLITAVPYGLISYYFNYLFQVMVSPAIFNPTLAYFSRTVFICQNLHWVALMQIIIGSIALYAKKPQGQEGQTFLS